MFTKVASVSGLVLVATVLALCAGVSVNWSEVMDPGSPAHRIVFELRLPRLFLVFFSGAALAAVGATYQILFHNPLAEPYLLGISSAAVLGIAVAEAFFGLRSPSLPSQLIGLTSALTVTVALLGLAVAHRGSDIERVALFGLGVNFVLSSILFLLLSYQSQHIGGGSLRWLFGQVPWISPAQAWQFSIVVCGALTLLVASSRPLDALGFGDGVARSLGFSPLKIKVVCLALTSALVAWLVSFCGSIGFVGLVIPHLARLVYHPSTTRKLFLLVIPLGGGFLLLSDALSRNLLPPMEFPVGIVTTLLGGPLFLVLLWKR